MRIEVIENIDKETRLVYAFNLFDLTLVLVTYSEWSKPKGKRNWIAKQYWDKYSRDNTCKEPVLPNMVAIMAIEQVKEMISAKTWDEWKGITKNDTHNHEDSQTINKP